MPRIIVCCISLLVSGLFLFLQSCSTLTTVPSRSMDTWLLGVWKYTDHQGNRYRVGIFPLDSAHYSIEVKPLSGPASRLGSQYFKAFISRVDQMYFLNLIGSSRNLPSIGPMQAGRLGWPFGETDTVLFAHYQLESPIEMVITPLHLSVPGTPFSWKLRREIRILAKAGLLLPPQNSLLWLKTSEVYWQKNASLESQPYQPLRIPIPNPKLPPQDESLQVGPTKGFRVGS